MTETLSQNFEKSKKNPNENDNSLREIIQNISDFASDLSFIKDPKQRETAVKMTSAAKEYNQDVYNNIPNIVDFKIEWDTLSIIIKDPKTWEEIKAISKSDFVKMLDYLKKEWKVLFNKADNLATKIYDKLNNKNLSENDKKGLSQDIKKLFSNLNKGKIKELLDKIPQTQLEQVKKKTQEYLSSLQNETEKKKIKGILDKFTQFEKTQDWNILAEIRKDLKPPFSKQNKKIYDDLENLYYQEFDKYAKKIRDNLLEIDASKILSDDKIWNKSLKDYLLNFKEVFNRVLENKKLPSKIKTKIKEKLREIDEKIKKLWSNIQNPERQKEIQEEIHSLFLDLTKKLNTDESWYLLKVLKLGWISDKINLWKDFLLDENNQIIENSQIEENKTYVLNSPKKENDNVDLITILPENIIEIEFNWVKYSRWKKGFFRNLPQNNTEAELYKKNKDKFLYLSLKSWDSFKVLQLWENGYKKEENQIIKESIMKDIKSLSEKMKKWKSINISNSSQKAKIETWWDLTDTLMNNDIPVIWTAIEWIWKEIFNNTLDFWISWAAWLLELIVKMFFEIFGADFGIADMAKNLREEAKKSSETPNRRNSKVSNWLQTAKTEWWQYEQINVAWTENIEEIKNNNILPNNIRKIDWKYIRFDKMDTSPLIWHDLWEYLIGNKWKDAHKKYLPTIIEIEEKTKVPAEVLINLIYHEDGWKDWITDKNKNKRGAFWLWQHFEAAWKESIDYAKNYYGINLPENRFNSNEKQQIWATALYLKHQKEKNWTDWIGATIAYNAWNLNPKDYKKNFIHNKWIAKKVPWLVKNKKIDEELLDKLTPKDYITAAKAYYFDMTFEEAKNIPNWWAKNILKEKFKKVKIWISWEKMKQKRMEKLPENLPEVRKKILEEAFKEIGKVPKLPSKENHCTWWVNHIYKKSTWFRVYDSNMDFNWTKKINIWTGIGVKEYAWESVIANIQPWDHIMLDKPRNWKYWIWKTHSVIALETPYNGLVKVISYPNNNIPVKIETYDLYGEWRWNKNWKVIRINSPKI